MTKYLLVLSIKSNVIIMKKAIKTEKKTLKQHRSKCKQEIKYKCHDCDDTSYIYRQIVDLKNRNHLKVTCNICETKIYL